MQKGITTENCVICGNSFEKNWKRSPQKKYCGKKCQMESLRLRAARTYVKKEIEKNRECKYCGEKFTPKTHSTIYCDPECRLAANQYVPKEIKSLDNNSNLISGEFICPRPKKLPTGHYVYGWCDPSTMKPYYVGRGTGNRAWVRHNYEVNGITCPSDCERQRRRVGVRVVIFRYKLTLEGAMLVESVLIETFIKMGITLQNGSQGISRKEIPPLEIE